MKEEIKKLQEEIRQLKQEVVSLRLNLTLQPLWFWYPPLYPTYKTTSGIGTGDFNANDHTITGIKEYI